MSISYFRIFFSRIRERSWLNKLGKQGLLLNDIRDNRYYFEKNEGGRYFYAVEYLPAPYESEEADKYIEARKASGAEPVFLNGRWIYFVSETEIPVTRKTALPSAKVFAVRAFYTGFFGLIAAAVTGYQFYAINWLESVGRNFSEHTIKTLTLNGESIADKMLDALKYVLNLFIRLANLYFSLWYKMTGITSGAMAGISITAPIALVLMIFCALNVNESLSLGYFAGSKKKELPDVNAAAEKDGDSDAE